MQSTYRPPCAAGVRPNIDFLAGKRRVLISSHEKPDGDALGASLALRRILAANGVEALLVGYEPLAGRYRFLLEPGEILPADQPAPDVDGTVAGLRNLVLGMRAEAEGKDPHEAVAAANAEGEAGDATEDEAPAEAAVDPVDEAPAEA